MTAHLVLTGKGSAGKSVIASVIARRASADCRVLLADADPHGSATRMLTGRAAPATLGALRNKYAREWKSGAGLEDETREEHAERALGEEALIHADRLDILPMGVSQMVGCQCLPNRVMSRALSGLLTHRQYDLVIWDNEAGLEHIGRYADWSADMLLMVIQPEMEYFSVARAIWNQIQAVQRPVRRAYTVVNRWRENEDLGVDELRAHCLEYRLPSLRSVFPESRELRTLSRMGGSPSGLSADDSWRRGVEASAEDWLKEILIPVPAELEKV